MTRQEFLAKLGEALENDLSGSIVQENVDYYNTYILEETAKGRAEEEVTAELGDPWAIARTIIDMAETTAQEETYETVKNAEERSERQNHGYRSVRTFSMDSWWQKLVLILGLIGVILIVVAVIGGIIALILPLVVPILIIALVIRFVGNARRR